MRVLIADDESLIRLGLKGMLQEMGHEALLATNGREALELARRQQPELAILDVKMPLTDGLQAARAMYKARPLPILLLTAFSEKDLVEQAVELPIHGYLVKPVRPAELAAAMAVAVRRFGDAQALEQRAAELEETLAARKLVDRARARLMAGGMSEEEAFREIQRRARTGRKTMAQVAEEILSRPG
jgi:response regulator NasT